MADHRKPPSSAPGRTGTGTVRMRVETGKFTIESTTMRLKSMRLRRAEKEKQDSERRAADELNNALDPPTGDRPAGRVRHDERGMAVWDWGVASGEYDKLSTTRALKKLAVADLKIEETSKTPKLALESSGRDKGGGFDPYNQRGSGKRQGEAATRQGVTGSKDRDRAGVLNQLLGKKK